MSYAAVAASGPKQSAEEARAAPVPSLAPSESDTASLVDVDSPHVVSVPSDYESQSVKTDTQAERMDREAEDKARAKAQEAEKKAEATAQEAKEKAQEAKESAKEKAQEAKDKAQEKAKKAKAAAKEEGKKLQENSDNPVYIANALIWTIGTVALGIGAYQKHTEGKLDAKLAGTVAAGIGAFAVADYFASSWLLENKYPTK